MTSPHPFPLRMRTTLRAALTRQHALPRGLLRFPDAWHSGTTHSQCPVYDHYDWSGLEQPTWTALFAALNTPRRSWVRTLLAGVRAVRMPKGWGLAIRSSDP